MISACRACKGTVELVLSLGEQYVSDFPRPNQEAVKVPLDLVKCSKCQLVQLGESVSPDQLYSHFWYQSGLSSSMKQNLREIAESTDLNPGDVALDIGCNDGTLFTFLPSYVTKVGFEPAMNVAVKAQERGYIIQRYFSAEHYLPIFKPAQLVTSIAMFYDLEDPNRFVQDIARVMAKDGTWIVQMNYLPAMLEHNCYDNICHEHLEYYSLTSFLPLLEKHGLEAYKVSENMVNGGSFRIYVSHKGERPKDESVQRMLSSEKEMQLDTVEPYKNFIWRINALRDQLVSFIQREVNLGKKVYVYGASTRGNTILQYTSLHNPTIKKATDANTEKHGRVTVGTNIPIISKADARRDNPDYFLVLPYHLLPEILKEEENFQGKFIIPLPTFKVIP